mgnify:CR=1 FL=1
MPDGVQHDLNPKNGIHENFKIVPSADGNDYSFQNFHFKIKKSKYFFHTRDFVAGVFVKEDTQYLCDENELVRHHSHLGNVSPWTVVTISHGAHRCKRKIERVDPTRETERVLVSPVHNHVNETIYDGRH